MDVLGDSYEEILIEKMHIIWQGSIAITGYDIP